MTLTFFILSLIKHTYIGKVLASLFGFGVTLLAIGEATNNQTLILVAIIGLFGVMITSGAGVWISVNNSRRLQAQGQDIQTLKTNTDGIMTKLEDANKRTSLAEQEVAHHKGVDQERRERDIADAAVAKVTPTAAVSSPPVHKMEIVSSDENPVTTKPAKTPPKEESK